MDVDSRPSSTRRISVAFVALVALIMGLLSTTGVDAQTGIEARGTDTVCEPPFTSSFTDIAGSVHEDNVLCLADYGITRGTGDGTTYSPLLPVNRAQMASFIARYIEHYTGETLPLGQARFDDVPADFVHHDAIHKLLAAGVTQGTSASGGASFAPQDLVTRAQMATFISRASSFIENGQAVPEHQPPRTANNYFPDDDGSVHEPNINALASVGIVQGFADGTYRPGNPVSRDQMASFVMRAYDWAVEVDLGDGPADPGEPGEPGEPGPVDPGPVDPGPVDPGEYDTEVTVQLNWQNEYREVEAAFGGVDDYAAFHLDNDGVGEVTLKWNLDEEVLVTEGEVTVTSRIPGDNSLAGSDFHLHAAELAAEGPVDLALPAPTFVGDAADEPGAGDRGLFTYSLDGTVSADSATLEALDAALNSGLIDWYVNVHTVHNPAGEVRGQLSGSDADGGLSAIVPQFEFFEFHELGEGTNTGEDQTSFNLWFDVDIAFAGETGQQRPQPADFVLEINGVPHEILRVRGDNPDWQPYPKQDIRIHLDTHEVVEDGDVVEITLLDSGAEKLVPVGRDAGADDLSDSWRERCTVVLSVPAMTSEPCGTPDQPGLSGFAATEIDSAPNQEQEFTVTIEDPGLPPRPGPAGDYEGEPWELWIDLVEVSFDGLVDYSNSTWTATIDGTPVGTVEFWEYEEVERFQTVWEPFLVFTHDEDLPVAGELVLTGTDIDGSDAAVFGEDTSYDSFAVRYDTGRAAYTEIVVNHVPQPLITLEPADEVVLAESGAEIEMTATYTDVNGDPVDGADIRFWVEQGERPDVVEVGLGTVTTADGGIATITYEYDDRDVEAGDPLVDVLRAELVADPFVDAETTVTWATGIATNDGPGEAAGATYHDLNDAITDAEDGDTITALGDFTSVYGLPRGDRVHVNKADLTLQADELGGATLIGAFDVRANGITLDGFTVGHDGSMQYAVRVEGAGITISNNEIDANGADGIRVRDPWGPVAGGGSASISDNRISDGAVGIDVDNHDQTTALVTDLTIEGNFFENNQVGIHYNPDAGTATIAGNTFEADVAGIVYIRDGTDDEDLDLEDLLTGNTYDPAAEILGRSIVPIDPLHVPEIVRVVEHGTGQGNQYTIIEYTRGVDCDVDGAAVGSQFTLDRGTEVTPNRIGEDVDCGWDGQSNLVRITWDGNPSFPNEILYEEHTNSDYHIHNEHELDGGGFTSALSPDSVGSPFPKPDDDVEVSGAVHFTSGGESIDGQEFSQDQEVTDVDLVVGISDRSEPDVELNLWFDGARPGEGFTAGEDICTDLLTAASCTAIQDALTDTNPFTGVPGGDEVFLDGVTLQIAPDADPGEWQLRWWVVDADTEEAYFADIFTVTIIVI